jgi:uncharacterized membrane protein YeaQ/YmgE (transglycosylase-associated protein family)
MNMSGESLLVVLIVGVIAGWLASSFVEPGLDLSAI